MPLPGGGADKAGGSYERQWTLNALLDVLQGRAEALRIEVPGDAGVGFEFSLTSEQDVSWHQVKRQRAAGPWSVAALVTDGVLSHWPSKLANGERCVFTSTTEALVLRELSEGARAAVDADEFFSSFTNSSDRTDGVNRLSAHWGVDRATLFVYLGRIQVTTIDETQLRRLNEVATGTLLDADPPQAAAMLLAFLDESVHHVLDRSRVWRYLLQRGIEPKRNGATDPPTYLKALRANLERTPTLEGREEELTTLRHHALVDGGYYVYVGAPWAGKTALLSHATSQLSNDADVAFFFVSRRAAQADVDEFLEAVIPQLDWIAGSRSSMQRATALQFAVSWERALRSSEAQGRRLVLVIDGLDEEHRSARKPSIASLLPAQVSDGGAVIVSTRPNPSLPPDLAPDHPLRHAVQKQLVQADAAREVQELATLELESVFAEHGSTADISVAHGVVCALAAAGGPLAVPDIAGITHESVAAIDSFVRWRGARILEPTGDGRFRFAHQTLLDASMARMDALGDRPNIAAALAGWMETWRAARWAGEVPLYLLREYPLLLLDKKEGQAAELLQDERWLVAAIRRIGIRGCVSLLSRAAGLPATPDAVAELQRVLELEIPALSRVEVTEQPGFIERQICLGALRRSVDNPTIRALRDGLSAAQGASLLPSWTTALEPDGLVRRERVGVAADDRPVLAASDDGSLCVYGGSGSPRLLALDVGSGMQTRLLHEAEEWIFGLAVTTSGHRVAILGQSHLAVFDLAAGEVTWKWDEDAGMVTLLAIDPAGSKVAVGDEGRLVEVLDVNDAALDVVVECSAPVMAVGFNSTGSLVTLDDSTMLEVWDAGTGRKLTGRRLCKVRHNHLASISADGAMAAIVCSAQDIITASVPATGRLRRAQLGFTPRALMVDSVARTVSLLGDDGVLRVWDDDEGTLCTLGRFEALDEGENEDGWTEPCGAVGNGVVAVATPGGEVSLWNTRAASMQLSERPLPAALAGAGGRLIYVDGEGVVSLVGHDGTVEWEDSYPLPDPVALVRASVDGAYALVVGEGGSASLLTLGGRPKFELLGVPVDGPASIAVAGSDFAVIEAESSLFVVPLVLGASPREIDFRARGLRSIAASRSTGVFAALAGDRSISFWAQSDDGQVRVGASVVAPGSPRGLAVSGDGSSVYICDAEGVLRRWRPGDADCVDLLAIPERSPFSVDVDPSGTRAGLLTKGGRAYALALEEPAATLVGGLAEGECRYVDASQEEYLVLGLTTGVALYSYAAGAIVARCVIDGCDLFAVSSGGGVGFAVAGTSGGVTAWRLR